MRCLGSLTRLTSTVKADTWSTENASLKRLLKDTVAKIGGRGLDSGRQKHLERALSTPYSNVTTATYHQRIDALREIFEVREKAGILGQPEKEGRWENLSGEDTTREGKNRGCDTFQPALCIASMLPFPGSIRFHINSSLPSHLAKSAVRCPRLNRLTRFNSRFRTSRDATACFQSQQLPFTWSSERAASVSFEEF